MNYICVTNSPLCVQMLNETKLEDMISMKSLHKHVPGRLQTTSITSESGETFDMNGTVYY